MDILPISNTRTTAEFYCKARQNPGKTKKVPKDVQGSHLRFLLPTQSRGGGIDIAALKYAGSSSPRKRVLEDDTAKSREYIVLFISSVRVTFVRAHPMKELTVSKRPASCVHMTQVELPMVR